MRHKRSQTSVISCYGLLPFLSCGKCTRKVLFARYTRLANETLSNVRLPLRRSSGFCNLISAKARPEDPLGSKTTDAGNIVRWFHYAAPSSVAFCVFGITIFDAKYTSQFGGIGPISGVIFNIPPAGRPSLANIVYSRGPNSGHPWPSQRDPE